MKSLGFDAEVLSSSKRKEKSFGHFRSRSLSNLLNISRQTESPVLSSVSSNPRIHDDQKPLLKSSQKIDKEPLLLNKTATFIVTFVLIEAKDLLIESNYFMNHGFYCKFRLGSESFKSKTVSNCQPEWRESFNIEYNDNFMKITLWDKAREKNSLGSCILDLSTLKRGHTHDIWRQLQYGSGSLHLSVTIRSQVNNPDSVIYKDEYPQESWIKNWTVIGQLHVTVHEARGLPRTNLNGKVSAYCGLELDNERQQTPNAYAYNTLHWNNSQHAFNVYDITSTLVIKIYSKSLMHTFKDETLGRVAIPLLKLEDRRMLRWYALKDKTRRNQAKGNRPRILLEIYIKWDAVKASLRLFRPKECKQVRKPPIFDLGLVYKNLAFIRDIFNSLYELNEHLMEFLEWDDRLKSQRVLYGYLIICYFFRLWMAPLVLIAPFVYRLYRKFVKYNNKYKITVEENQDVKIEYNNNDEKNDKTFSGRLHDLQDMTLTISGGIDYIACIIERMYNLTNFSVPFLSFLAIFLLIVSSIGLYYISVNYILMALGIYKFIRKRLNPDRAPNNDILDFISRIPDRGNLRDWRELDDPWLGCDVNNGKRNFTIYARDLKQQGVMEQDVQKSTNDYFSTSENNKLILAKKVYH